MSEQRMEFGLLWYDGDPKRALTAKVDDAAARYQARFGQRPNACFVHCHHLESELHWQGIRIVGSHNILPNHFWVGILLPA